MKNGFANVRVVFPNFYDVNQLSVYVGVVRVDGNIARLLKRLFPTYDQGGAGCGWCVCTLWGEGFGR